MKTFVKSDGSLFPAIPSLFDDRLKKDWLDSSLATRKMTAATLPAANVKETNETFVIEVAAPGMRRDNFKVELQNNLLSVSAEVHGHNNQPENYTRREFSYQSFHRSFTLPEDMVEASKISARYNNGMLFITVPKREGGNAKRPKVIAIS